MAITYHAGTNTITITGYSEATPCTFLDIYNADVAGGWGVVTNHCGNVFCFTAFLKIGDGSTVTWFADTAKMIVINDGIFTANDQEWLFIRTNGHARFGEVVNIPKKTGEDGCTFLSKEPTYYHGIIGGNTGTDGQFYSCGFQTIPTAAYPSYSGAVGGGNRPWKFWNCLFTNSYLRDLHNIDICNITLTRLGLLIGLTGTINNITVLDRSAYCLRFYQISATIKNVTLINCGATTFQGAYMQANDGYLINTNNIDHAVWAPTWQGTNTGKIYRQYELDLKVTDKDENALSGRAVKIWDKDDNLVVNVTTGMDGKIATQTLNHGYFPGGSSIETLQTPHTIQISGPGDQTYKKKFTVDEKTNWRIRLLQANPVQFLDGNPILQLAPESQENDRILFEVI